ncbi:MAG TPA: cytochrome c [Terriglobia bacterium]|nr:cytochrome c [Terriglobia bacterium]
MERNIFYRLLLAALALTLIATSATTAQTPAPASQSGNAENGKKLYVTYFCWSCHGSSGRAGGAAPAITPSARSADDLIKYIRKPRGAMPPYTSKSISDREIADIAAFLRTVPKDPDPKSIPLLNQQ